MCSYTVVADSRFILLMHLLPSDRINKTESDFHQNHLHDVIHFLFLLVYQQIVRANGYRS